MNDTSEIIDWMVKQLSNGSNVTKVILFGSWARGDADERSDINIAVEADTIENQQWWKLLETIEAAVTLFTVRLVRLDKLSSDMKEFICQEGIILYDRYAQ